MFTAENFFDSPRGSRRASAGDVPSPLGEEARGAVESDLFEFPPSAVALAVSNSKDNGLSNARSQQLLSRGHCSTTSPRLVHAFTPSSVQDNGLEKRPRQRVSFIFPENAMDVREHQSVSDGYFATQVSGIVLLLLILGFFGPHFNLLTLQKRKESMDTVFQHHQTSSGTLQRKRSTSQMMRPMPARVQSMTAAMKTRTTAGTTTKTSSSSCQDRTRCTRSRQSLSNPFRRRNLPTFQPLRR